MSIFKTLVYFVKVDILNDLYAFPGFSREEIVLQNFVIIGNTYSALSKLRENNVMSGTYRKITSSSLVSFFSQKVFEEKV